MMLLTGATKVDLALGALAFLLVIRLVTSLSVSRVPKGLRLPPGPRGKPVIGNVGDMPTRHEWETYTRWSREYGDLVYVKAFGQPMVFVNSMDVAKDLLEKRSLIYSDRPHLPMLMDLMGWSWSLGMRPYGPQWRRHRRMFYQNFNSTAVVAYRDIETRHTRALLGKFYESPENFVEHLRSHAGAIIMEIVYGIKVLPTDDPYIDIAEKALTSFSDAGKAGTFFVDAFPILKYVPEWMPGAGFQKKARIWRQSIIGMPALPFAAVKTALSAGTAESSVTASLLEALPADAPVDEEDVIRDSVANAYAGGSDTTVVALSTFMLAMVLYQEAQHKAQAELDAVIGMGRLPVFEDRKDLPYVNALCKEVFRWHPIVPIDFAHRLERDDVYGDYFIPRGTLVFGNIWAMLHDEKNYGPKPEEFEPERFLRGGVHDPIAAFGFGRRICPGRHMADDSIFIAVATILKVFTISPAKDDAGVEVPVKASFTSGLISAPEPFRCAITARSPSAQSLILEGDV